MLSLRAAVAALILLLGCCAEARAQEPGNDQGVAFDPPPIPAAQFDLADSPTRVENISVDGGLLTDASDDVKIRVATWEPVARPGGPAPASPAPVILVMTPYAALVSRHVYPRPGYGADRSYVRALVPHGYAVAVGHVLGTGSSGGCFDALGEDEVESTARVIEHLGARHGRVGMLGGSYDGMAALFTAALGPKHRLGALKAIVANETGVSWHDAAGSHGDGVPLALGTATWPSYLALSTVPEDQQVAAEPIEAAGTHTRPGCVPEHLLQTEDYFRTGNFNDFLAEREARRGAAQFQVPLLLAQGFNDEEISTAHMIGFFNRIPRTVPHKLLLGHWKHALPETGTHPRTDWTRMRLAWFDRYLKDAPNGVEDWPAVQVQDVHGQWRREKQWPPHNGKFGQLALRGGSGMGGQPAGPATRFRETGAGGLLNQVTFSTDALSGPLHLTGQPVLDLHVRLNRPDAHISVLLTAFDAENRRVGRRYYGARSVQHLDPMRDDHFEQRIAKPVGFNALDVSAAPAVRVPIRLLPLDVTVPAGGRLEVRIGGNNDPQYLTVMPSGADATVEILHDCLHPSALRFQMPAEDAELLNVRDPEEADLPLATNPSSPMQVDGGRTARQPICGGAPVDPMAVLRG